MDLTSAMIQWLLSDYEFHAINDFQLYFQYEKFFIEEEYNGTKINVRLNGNLENSYRAFIRQISSHSSFNSYSYSAASSRFYFEIIKGSNKFQVLETDLICSLFPNTYIHFLSAMRGYSLTDRIPQKIQLVVPERSMWKQLASEFIIQHQSNYNYFNLDKLSIANVVSIEKRRKKFLPVYPSKGKYFNNISLEISTTSNLLPSIKNGIETKTINIGYLFVEMIDSPEQCGGLQHVISIYVNYARFFIKDIIKAGNNSHYITQARIGFIFENILKIKDAEIMGWKKNQTRGGSRKFVASKPFSNLMSLEWNLSLNHATVKNFGTYINGYD